MILESALNDLPLTGLMHARVRAWRGRITQPDVCCDLVWLGERLFVRGPQSLARPSLNVGVELQVLNLDPLMARAWLRLPLSELADQQAPLEDLAPAAAGPLSELFHAGRGAALVRPATPGRFAQDPRAAQAAAVLRRTRSVTLAAEAVNLSERQLERLFHDRFGLPPKRYAQILRMRRAVRAARDGVGLAAAAAEAGYVDQAHFNRDVRVLGGATPRALIRNVGVSQDRIVRIRSD